MDRAHVAAAFRSLAREENALKSLGTFIGDRYKSTFAVVIIGNVHEKTVVSDLPTVNVNVIVE